MCVWDLFSKSGAQEHKGGGEILFFKVCVNPVGG